MANSKEIAQGIIARLVAGATSLRGLRLSNDLAPATQTISLAGYFHKNICRQIYYKPVLICHLARYSIQKNRIKFILRKVGFQMMEISILYHLQTFQFFNMS